MLVSICFASEGGRIHGIVRDASSREPLPGATIQFGAGAGTVSDHNGYFNFRHHFSDTILLKVSHIGYETRTVKSSCARELVFEILLTPGIQIGEVEVSGNYLNSREIGTLEIPIEQLYKIPSLSGEPDLLKAYQMMPGVQMGNEGTAGIYVRGGTPDQNLFLLDGVPLYNVSHMGGFLSVFDVSAIRKVNLYKGYMPARYGGRMSSVVDVRLKDGNASERKQEFMIGILASRYYSEGPLGEKNTYMLSVRRCNIDLPLRLYYLMSSSGQESFGYTFMDFNGKVTRYIDQKNKLTFLAYYGRDKLFLRERTSSSIYGYSSGLKSKSLYKHNWGNLATALNWNHILNASLGLDLMVGSTTYFNTVRDKFESKSNDGTDKGYAEIHSGITDLFVKADFNYYGNQSLLTAGLGAVLHSYTPASGSYSYKSSSHVESSEFADQIYRPELNAYIDYEHYFGGRITLLSGLNSIYWPTLDYLSLDPRVGVHYRLFSEWLLRSSLTRAHQYVHLLTTSADFLSPDVWVPSTREIKPSYADQLNLGVSYMVKGYELSLDIWEKRMHNLIAYKPGHNVTNTQPWEFAVEKEGKGTARGLEILAQKKHGRNTGWLGYSLSKNDRQFENLNFGRPFPFKYDRRHEIKAVFVRNVSERFSFSGSWMFASGNPTTIATKKVPVIDYTHFGYNRYEDIDIRDGHYYSGVNNFRMEPYHRLDFGFSFNKQLPKYYRTYYLGLYNAYSRLNPNSYFFKTKNGEVVFVRRAYFPIIPSVSYTLRF